MSRLRVAVVAACPFPYPRGTPVRILRLSEEIAARGHEVHVVTYHLGAGEVSDPIHLHRIRDALDAMLRRENRTELAKAAFVFLPTRALLDLDGFAETDIFAHS